MIDLHWRQDAACRPENAERFFPQGLPTRETNQTCQACPVRIECLETALAMTDAPSGQWGGLAGSRLLNAWRQHQEER